MSADRARRTAIAAWLVLAAVVWNVRFDYHIRMAAWRCVARVEEHARGRGARVTIDEVMRPAAAAGAREAILWSLIAAGPGLATVLWASRRRHAAQDVRP